MKSNIIDWGQDYKIYPYQINGYKHFSINKLNIEIYINPHILFNFFDIMIKFFSSNNIKSNSEKFLSDR